MDYINDRLIPQMQYYKLKSANLQKEFYILSIFSVILTALIPVLSIAADAAPAIKYIIALLSSSSSVLSSVLLLRKTKDKWIAYRITYEQLKKEKVMFELGAGCYQDKNICKLAERCEVIMQNEHSDWKVTMKKTSD